MLKQLVLCMLFLTLIGCATSSEHFQSGRIKESDTRFLGWAPSKSKNAQLVALYTQPSFVHRPYRILGKGKVNRHTLLGMEKQERHVHDLMKRIAASMGGDAVINIQEDEQKIEGTVISYEKVLL